jgi:mevalonate kinase
LNTPFYSNGKLLLTGEYLVLDGALSLAVPTKFGQSLIIEPIDEPTLFWKSVDYKGDVWFEKEFSLQNISVSTALSIDKNKKAQNDNNIAKRLIQILNVAKQLNPNFLTTNGFEVTTQLDFPEFWGLGSSSTLINNIANWAEINAYQLLEATFGGSGYDIACAKHDTAITYQTNQKPFDCAQGDNKTKRIINKIDFNPNFKEHLYFVHLNKKQNSREGIAHYKTNNKNNKLAIEQVSNITNLILKATTLNEFQKLIDTHEQIISNIINQKPIKERLFNDFNGSIKSLGAWGGDFVLVASKNNPTSYFKQKGFDTVITYCVMVL